MAQAQENTNSLAHIYDDTGHRLTFKSKADVLTIVTDLLYRQFLDAYELDERTVIQYPATVELEEPWSLKSEPDGGSLPTALQHALLIQLCPDFTRCSENPEPGEALLCGFSRLCRPGVTGCDAQREHRKNEGIQGLVPVFRSPRLFMMPEKVEVELSPDGKSERQTWRPFQFCTNCRAACAVARCSHWYYAVTTPECLEVLTIEAGAKSQRDLEYDHSYLTDAGFSYSDVILDEDIGNWQDSLTTPNVEDISSNESLSDALSDITKMWSANRQLDVQNPSQSEHIQSFYSPLDPANKEIRLVQILPMRSDMDTIRLKLFYISLEKFKEVLYLPAGEPEEMSLFKQFNITGQGLPCYYTLSYTCGAPYPGLAPEWSDRDSTKTVYLDDREFPVRWNLYAALQSLWRRFDEPRMFWIDAICIDQWNLEERASQVQLFPKIYKFAVRTYIWLGPASEDSELAFQTIVGYEQAWSARTDNLKGRLLHGTDAGRYQELAVQEIHSPDSIERLRAIANFFLRGWWSRTWIVQEAVLSMRLQFICGHSSPLEWASVQATRSLLQQHVAMGSVFGSSNDELKHLLYAIIVLSDRFQRIDSTMEGLSGGADYDLPQVLRSLRTSQCENPRDKVYAGLSLPKDASMVKVDYRLKVEDVFLSVSRGWIEKERDLHILDYCVPSSQPSSLPSWVADWTNTTKRLALPKKRNLRSDQPVYAAGGSDQQLNFRFTDDDPPALVLQGVPLETISFVREVGYDPGVHWAASLVPNSVSEAVELSQRQRNESIRMIGTIYSAEWLYSWLQQIDICNSPCLKTEGEVVGLEGADLLEKLKYRPTGEDIFNAFLRTCIVDVLPIDTDGSPRRMRIWPDSEFIVQLIETSLLWTLPGRTFIATSSGYMGVAPEAAQTGDWIVIVPGNETPLVLRYEGDKTCTLVGECYIHGIMDGQTLDFAEKMAEDGQNHMKEFKIV